MFKANPALLLACLAGGAVGAADATPQTTMRDMTFEWRDRHPQPRDDLTMRRTMLLTHATARAVVGVPPLAWSEDLAAGARLQAEDLAREGRFDHGGRNAAPRGVGENLWAGTRGGFSYGEMVAAWLDESRDYVNVPAPRFSRTGTWQDVGHYSQMVWRHTTEMGCALATGSSEDVLVCRYAPAGNVIGQAAF